MIAALFGTLIAKSAQSIVVDVHGVGYELTVPQPTLAALPAVGEAVRLQVHTHVREDALQLFGFLTRDEKALFLLVQEVSGVGPKLGLAIVSGAPLPELAAAIRQGDLTRLSAIPGVGKKTAARLALELKEKVLTLDLPATPAAAPADPVADDAVSALVNLGYRPQLAEDAVRRVARAGLRGGVEELIRDSLRILSR